MPFEKGRKKTGGKKLGSVSEKTRHWNELKDFVTEKGAEKYKQEIMSLEGKDFIIAYNNILEYFKPKLARTEIKHEGEINQTIGVEIEIIEGKAKG